MTDAEKPWGRRLIVCCDGTWQSSVSDKETVPSNVTKLCRVISRTGKDKENKNWHQVVYYDGGIGTGNMSKLEGMRQGGTGAGLAENVIEAYNFIALNYKEGDEIFCFGFSRGAYTARAVAGLIADIGVLKPLEMQFFPEVYRAYMTYGSKAVKDNVSGAWMTQAMIDAEKAKEETPTKPSGFAYSEAFEVLTGRKENEHGQKITLIEKPENMDLDKTRQIKVIGVWDTVGSLGVPDVGGIDHGRLRRKFGFHNVRLSSHVQHAYHALALDERREAFRPTLWYIDANSYNDGQINETKPKPELKQVWFPGVHINCGGGSDDGFLEMKGDMENISVATFTWMLQCISPHLDIDRQAFKDYLNQYEKWLTNIRYNCSYHHVKDEGYIEWAASYAPDIPGVGHDASPLDPPKRAKELHPHPDFDFGWGVGPIIDSFTKMYHLNGTRARRPGHEEMEVDGVWKPIAGTSEAPTGYETFEYIHPLVWHRFQVRDWLSYSFPGNTWPFKTTPPLAGWDRWYEVGNKIDKADIRQRYWWQRNTANKDKTPRYKDNPKWGWGKVTDKDTRIGQKLPEWAILPHSEVTGDNFERLWYETAQKMGHALSEIQQKRDAGKPDYLKTLDEHIKSAADWRAQNE